MTIEEIYTTLATLHTVLMKVKAGEDYVVHEVAAAAIDIIKAWLYEEADKLGLYEEEET